MAQLVVRLAQAWAEHPSQPQPWSDVLSHWDELIESWEEDASLPLFVRKPANNRGSVLSYTSGRQFVPTDNSPAQWAFALAFLDKTPTLDEVRDLITADSVPVAMILKRIERSTARFKCTLGSVVNPKAAGWKVAHVEGIGLSSDLPLVDLGETQLRQHFRQLMVPRNMFVVPTSYTDLGELPEFCDAMRKFMQPA